MKNKKKNALRKDFFMEIRKSMGRFLSIGMIVMLGVSLLVGLHATEPDMILSGDTYADENKLMDIKVVSTYGLTEDDVDVIERLPAIESVEGAYSTDVLCNVEEDKRVIHVMAETDKFNTITVVDGRLPKNEKECLVDKDFLDSTDYEIGDAIVFESGTDAELTDTLTQESFKIVGSGTSPLYFSFQRGSSTIGNGAVSGFVVVSPEAFSLDVFTEIYAMVDGARDARSFTEDYEVLVNDAIEQIQLIQNVRCEVRRDDLANEAQLEIDNARKELNSKKEEAEKEISENEDKLDDAELDIKIGKAQVESSKMQLESTKTMLQMIKGKMDSLKEDYSARMSELEKKKKALENEIAEAEKESSEIEDEVAKEAALAAIQSMRGSLNDVNQSISNLLGKAEAEFAAIEKEIAQYEADIIKGERELAKAERDLAKAEKEVASGKDELENAKGEMESEISDAEEEIDEAEEEISKIEIPIWYIFDRSAVSEYQGFGDNAARIGALCIVFPTMFFLVAALISLTTMTRMIEEQRVQIGTLKALGYSKFSIVRKYLNYALCATIGGGIIGILFGEKLLPYVIIDAYYNTVYNNIPQILIPYRWGIGIVALLIASCCTGGATLAACYKELLAQPANLMRPAAPQIGKRTWIEKIPFLWKHLNFSWKSSLRNLFRYKKRFFMTIFGIGGCMGLLMVGYGLRDSISSISAKQYGELQLFDCSIFISDDMEPAEREEFHDYLKDNKDVTNYMDVCMQSVKTQHDDNEIDCYMYIIDDLEESKEFFVYRDRKSKEIYELTEEGIIISEKTASMLNVEAGDSILLMEEGISEHKVKILAVCENYLEHYVYITQELYIELYGKEPFENSVIIRVDESLTRADLEKIGEQILTYDDILNVQYTESTVESIDGMLIALDNVMIFIILFAGLLSFIVLYNLNNINITERRRELATLKVLGFYNGEVAMYVYRENILLTLLGTLVGCGIGKFLHRFTIVTVEVDMAMFGRDISIQSYLICAAYTIVFSIIVNIFMYFKLKKINMVESLKSVE